MAKPTKQAAWDWFWTEINHITQLDTLLDEERKDSVNEMLERITKLQESGNLSITQIYELGAIIKLAHESGLN